MPNFVSCLGMAKFGSFVYNFCKSAPNSMTKNCKKRHEERHCFTIFLHAIMGNMRHENKSLASRVKPRNGNAIAP